MDSNLEVTTEKVEETEMESSTTSVIAAPPPSPSNSQQHSESESPVHVVKVHEADQRGAVDTLMNEISKNNTETFNEIESELVQLNLSGASTATVSVESLPTSSPETLEEAIRKQQSTVTCIKETVKMDVDNEEMDMDEVPLSNKLVDEEEPDTLSPLLSDNHTHIIHSEMLVNGHYYTPIMAHDDTEDEMTSVRTTTCLNPLARSFMRPSPEQGQESSCSDSDLSLSFDRKQLTSNSTSNNNSNDGNNSSDEFNNKEDSGCEVKNGQNLELMADLEGPVEMPDDETCLKIVEQVEFYFSDESLLKDAFLLKHVRRNKEGFVSLKLVSSFKRVRQICKDWRAVGLAIKKCSQKIEMNDLNTKIRRLEPLPDYDETLPSRTIVATGLPCDKLTIEKVSDIFSKCGEIALVRILRPGGQIPADVRQFMNKHPELLENECALVEFNESAAARVAQQMEGLYVLELVLPKKKTGKKANVTKLVENLKYSSESDSERNRGGEIAPNNRFHLKRNNSAFYIKPEQNTYIPPPRRMSFGNDTNAFEHFQNKRFQNMMQQQHQPLMMSGEQTPQVRRYSTCSDAYNIHDNTSRRSSLCSSELSRRYSNCSQEPQMQQQQQAPLRRYSNCSDFCSCSRRASQSSDMGGFRRISQTSMGSDGMSRKFSGGSSYSSGSGSFQERRFSNASDMRRVSVDSMNGYERKISGGSMGSGGFESHSPRKYSNGFDPFRKLSNTDQYYINGRRISTDSGYDRRMSFGSDVSGIQQQIVPQSPVMTRGRSGSIFNNNESVVRTPIGPDGSKGFVRARRFGQVIPPV